MKPMPRTEGEVQCWEHNCEVYVKAQDYADLNEHSALVEMNLQAQIDLNEANEAYEARLLAEADMLRARIAEGHRLLLKMCAAQDLMPDDVAVWLGYTHFYASTASERGTVE